MRQGAGKLHIINVNSNRDPGAMNAFVAAILSDNKIIRLEPEGEHEEHSEHEATEPEEEHEPAQEARAESAHSRPVSVARRTTPSPRTSARVKAPAEYHEEPHAM